MARIYVDGPDLVVGLSLLEKLGAFRGNVRVPLSTIRSAEVDPEPWSSLRGIRAMGTGIPGVVALGLRRRVDGWDFAALHGRSAAVRVDLDRPSHFGRLLVSVPDPQKTAAAIHATTGV
jgi:hypothetical protein